MWLAMAPARLTTGQKENWLFRCPVCEVVVPGAEIGAKAVSP
jgi:hypothetical protein